MERQRSEEEMQPETVSAEAQARLPPPLRIKLGIVRERRQITRRSLQAVTHTDGGIQWELCRTGLKHYATCAGKVRQISAHEDTSKEEMAVKIKQVSKDQWWSHR